MLALKITTFHTFVGLIRPSCWPLKSLKTTQSMWQSHSTTAAFTTKLMTQSSVLSRYCNQITLSQTVTLKTAKQSRASHPLFTSTTTRHLKVPHTAEKMSIFNVSKEKKLREMWEVAGTACQDSGEVRHRRWRNRATAILPRICQTTARQLELDWGEAHSCSTSNCRQQMWTENVSRSPAPEHCVPML